MEVQLPSDLQFRLGLIAQQQGRDSAALVAEAVERLVSHDEWFRSEVKVGLDQISQGHTLSHEEVGERLNTYLTGKRQTG